MKLIGKIELDLEKMFSGDDWNTTIADVIRDEFRKVLRETLRVTFRTDVTFTGAMAKIREKAALEIIDQVLKWEDHAIKEHNGSSNNENSSS